MKIQLRVSQEPGGTPLTRQPVNFTPDGASIATRNPSTDGAGFVRFEESGHTGPFMLSITGRHGGDRYWRSNDVRPAGAIDLSSVPAALTVLGDGVVRGHESELRVSLESGNRVRIATGSALVDGHPFVNYRTTDLVYTRPASGSLLYRVVVTLRPGTSTVTPGRCWLQLLAGTASLPPALAQTSQLYRISLAQVRIPAVGNVVVTDERAYTGSGLAAVTGHAHRVAAHTTTSTLGAGIPDLLLTLSLPRPEIYDVEASLNCQQFGTADYKAWQHLDTYDAWPNPDYDPEAPPPTQPPGQQPPNPSGGGGSGWEAIPTFTLFSPGQLAIDRLGRILIADTGNSRLVILDAYGTFIAHVTGLPGITGVCVDLALNIYVRYVGGLRKYTSALIPQWTQVPWGKLASHLATDTTHLYYTTDTPGAVNKCLCSTGAFVASYGMAGTGNNQFSAAYGIAYNRLNQLLYVVDRGNARVQTMTTTGAYRGQFFVGTGARGVAIDSTGRPLVALHVADTVVRYDAGGIALDSFHQADALGVAVAAGDVVWATTSPDIDGTTVEGSLDTWDEIDVVGGHGQVAIAIAGDLSPYLGIGDRDGALDNAETATAQGPGTVTIQAFAKATLATCSLSSLVLSASATPRG